MDWGASWSFVSEALALNPYCPWDTTDPDNLNVNVNGVKTAYGSSAATAADNGLGHPVVLNINGVQRLCNLNRANGHINSDQLVVHTPSPAPAVSQYSLPDYGFVSPVVSGAIPSSTPRPQRRAVCRAPTRSWARRADGQDDHGRLCGKDAERRHRSRLPGMSLDARLRADQPGHGKPRKANHDVTIVRVATTTDGVNFTDVGPASSASIRRP